MKQLSNRNQFPVCVQKFHI